MRVQLKANLQPVPKKWSEVEIRLLLKLYPLYKAGNQRYTAGVLRGHLQSRTMAAISKKYWEIMGSTHIKRENINQMNFDFLQEKLNAKL